MSTRRVARTHLDGYMSAFGGRESRAEKTTEHRVFRTAPNQTRQQGRGPRTCRAHPPRRQRLHRAWSQTLHASEVHDLGRWWPLWGCLELGRAVRNSSTQRTMSPRADLFHEVLPCGPTLALAVVHFGIVEAERDGICGSTRETTMRGGGSRPRRRKNGELFEVWSWLSLWRLTLGLFRCTEPKDYHVGVQLENSARIEGRHNFDNQFSSVSTFVLITCSCNFRVLVYQYRAADSSPSHHRNATPTHMQSVSVLKQTGFSEATTAFRSRTVLLQTFFGRCALTRLERGAPVTVCMCPLRCRRVEQIYTTKHQHNTTSHGDSTRRQRRR